MAWRRSTPDFITGISPCAASAWGDGRLPAPCARDTAGDPRITSHWLTGRCGSREPSEGEAQRTLHHTRCAGGRVARRVKPRRGVDAGILRVVEGVVSFPAELEVALVTLHVEPLGKRHVPVVDARIADTILSGIARVIHAWPGEGRRVEPLVEGVPSGVGVADHIDALAIATTRFVCADVAVPGIGPEEVVRQRLARGEEWAPG